MLGDQLFNGLILNYKAVAEVIVIVSTGRAE